MTPFQLFREAPVRIRSWPTVWKVLVCSALSTTLAVVLMAWQATGYCPHRHHHRAAAPAPSWQPLWPTPAVVRERMEEGCELLEYLRVNRAGFYAEDAP